MTYNIKRKRKTNKDIGYNNSSRRFRPLGSRAREDKGDREGIPHTHPIP